MWAAGAFRGLTANIRQGRYRDDQLEQVELAEDRHILAVHYVWVHSHVGITPNEAADVEADNFVEKPSARNVATRKYTNYSLQTLGGVTGSPGRLVYE